MRNRSLAVALALLAFAVASQPAPAADCPTDKLALWTGGVLRGANVFQGRNPGGATNGFGDGDFTQADFDDLAHAGANYLQISHAGVFAETPPYALDPAAEANLDHVIDMATTAGLYVGIAMRSGPGRNENAISNRDGTTLDAIWTDQTAHAKWAEMMGHVAARYKDNPRVVGYSVMVEPNAYALDGYIDPDPFYALRGNTLADVNTLYADATTAIRAVDADTPILREPEGYGNIQWLPHLVVSGDRIVYTPHDYTPFDYTHEQVQGATYPGDYDVDGDGNPDHVDAAFLQTWLGAVKTFGTMHGVPVAITEFGVHKTAASAGQYLADRIAIQDGIGSWAVWTWQPAGFDDPFNMHDPSSVLNALRAGWADNCTPTGATRPTRATLQGTASVLRKNGSVGKPLKKVRITIDGTTTKTPRTGAYATELDAGTHTLSARYPHKRCHLGAADAPTSLDLDLAGGEVRVIDVLCGKR